MKRLAADQIKQIEYEILIEFDRICKDNGLTYCLAYGTALGAERHNGFIPWDDDIDVHMPRKDYERLFDLFSEGLKSSCDLVSYRDDSSIYQFAKLVDKKTTAYETFVGPSRSIGLWIDIFPLEPLDSIKDKKLKKTLKLNSFYNLWRNFAVADTNTGSTRMIVLIKKLVCPFAKHLNVKKMNEKLDAIARDFSTHNSEMSPYLIDCIGGGIIYKRSSIFPAKPGTFEGRAFPCPANPDDYLATVYGNWKQVPPEDKRAVHFPTAFLKDEE